MTGDVEALLARLDAQDIRLALDGAQLRINAPKHALTDELRAELRRRKDEIVAHLGRAAERGPRRDRPIERVPRVYPMPLSHMQQRLWFMKQLDPLSAAYHVPGALRLRGVLDVGALERALADLVARHEGLRTRFVTGEQGPGCIVEARASIVLERADLDHVPAAEREEAATHALTDLARRPFDLGCCPLLRTLLLRIAADDHAFCLVVDHIIADGLSMAILFAELAALYTMHATGRAVVLPELRVQYVDYAEWQRHRLADGALQRHLAYWKEQLRGAPPVLQLPTDHPRPRIQTTNGARPRAEFPAELMRQLKALGRREGATLYMVLIAAFQVLLHRYTGGEDDIVIGTAVANRDDREVENLVGFFANNIVLRGDLSGEPTVRELLQRVRGCALQAYEHGAMPFDVLVDELAPRRDLAHSPLFQVLFVLQTATRGGLDFAGLRVAPMVVPLATSRFDLAIDATELPDERLHVYFEYNTDLFDAATIGRMIEHYHRLLVGFARQAEARVGSLPMLADAERAALFAASRHASSPYPQQQTVHGLFEAQATARPEAEAVRFEDRSLSYAQLNRRANQLARHLRSRGVSRETPVGVWLERSPEMVVALLGILKAGGAYVPLDPSFPRERLQFMAADAGLAVIVTQTSLAALAPGDGALRVSLDADAADIASRAGDDLPALAGADDLAYIIYTSGSTGTPKGVQVEHRSVVNFLLSMLREPGLTAADRLLGVTTLSFDIAGLEIHGPLAAGATVVLASRETGLDGHRLAALLDASEATVLQATPATWRLLLDAGWQGRHGLKMLCGGEALPRELAQRLLATGGQLWNLYGPTETTIWSTLTRVDSASGPISIGRPIANTRLHVLEASGLPAPIGVPGELCIAGDGLARGYRNRPELTAEKFASIALPDGSAERVYRTGDLVRWRNDGELEFCGRRDHQVKLRGFRIELGEIEVVLEGLAAVKQCVVLAREDEPGDQRLVAYVVAAPGAVFEIDAARAALRARLPEYMLPNLFVTLPALPLTPNGKVDRRALPVPNTSAAGLAPGFVPPRSPTEQALCEIWRDTLRISSVGRSDDFFELGGHSLAATQVASRIRAAFRTELPLHVLFEARSIESLAERVDAALRDRLHAPPLPAIAVAAVDGPAPLSFAQERMWLIHALAPDETAYNIPAVVRLHGPLDEVALSRSLHALCQRHEALRTTYLSIDGVPMQQVEEVVGGELKIVDLRTLGAQAADEALRVVHDDAVRPFDLAAGPVMRSLLCRIADEEHLLLLNLHHISGDHWSLGLMGRELATLYNDLRAGRAPSLAPLPISYRDFAAWQRGWLQGEELHRQLSFWQQRLAGLPALELPADRPRPAMQSLNGTWHVGRLQPELIEQVEQLSRREGCTFFMTVFAAFAVLLHRLSGQDDFAIGVPIANRHQLAVEGLVGTFVNTLALRVDLSGAPTVQELLRRVRGAALDAYAHQDAPFEKLVETLVRRRDASRAPLVQVLLNVQNAPMQGIAFDELSWQAVPVSRGAAQFELSLSIDPHLSRLVVVEYNTDLYDTTRIERLLGQFTEILRGMVAKPVARIGALPLLPFDEWRQVLTTFNATEAAYPDDTVFARLFEAQVAQRPQAIAVGSDGTSLCYGELNARANRLAHRLRALGVERGSLVGVCLHRGLNLAVALVAVHKSGAAYVPLDPRFPAERLGFMLADSGAAVVVTAGDAAQGIELPSHIAIVDLQSDAARLRACSDANLEQGARPDDLAYVIYTSGTTGRPKGVAVPHGALVNFLWSMKREPGVTESDIFAAVTTISFDIAGLELYLPWIVGARVELIPHDTAADGYALAERLSSCGATMLQATPATWRLLLEAGWQGHGRLRALCGGEALPRELADALLGRVGELWNLYGPTETTVWSTVERVTPGPAPIGIGRPIANTQVYVLDRAGEPVPIGVPGEIWIGGAGVAHGYHRRPELSEERFVADRFSNAAGARLYRTGDLGRWNADGRLQHLGRLDHQVKIRGFRIELGEIETVLASHEAVRQAVVVAREASASDLRLVAYVVYAPGEDPTVGELRRHLRRDLPDYMVPSMVIALDQLPLTPNGKIDRAALPDPFNNATHAAVEHEPPAPGVERLLADVWQDVLQIGGIGAESNFFELGGHSLLALRVAAAVHKRTGWRMDPRSLFFQSLRQVAAAAPAEAIGGSADRPT